jgi:uncharacterized membrane protein YedE/YeeE
VKSNFMNQNIVSFLVGLLFATGLAISGMTQPQKVIGFLNPWAWDPALLFVMAGAIGVHALTHRLIKRRASPLLDEKWHVPQRKDLSTRLVLGSAIFGIGWGLGGYCPGPGLASLTSGDIRPVGFVAAMIVGMFAFKRTAPYLRMRE